MRYAAVHMLWLVLRRLENGLQCSLIENFVKNVFIQHAINDSLLCQTIAVQSREVTLA